MYCVCERERERGNLLPSLEDGFDVAVKVWSCESSHLETVVDSVCLLQLHNLLGQLQREREGERGQMYVARSFLI